MFYTDIRLITKYFKNLSQDQISRFTRLEELYRNWNSKINVISRKDIDQLYLHHILHSLAIAAVIKFKAGTRILDAGTGGGFPGIPLAIFFPKTDFLLADSIAKKTKVADAIIQELELNNCKTINTRIEKIDMKFDFIVSRAVTTLPVFLTWTENKIKSHGMNSLKNGILYLKGGNIDEELKALDYEWQIFHIQTCFSEVFFETKKLVYVNTSKIVKSKNKVI